MLGSSESEHTCIINQLILVAVILVKHVTLLVDMKISWVAIDYYTIYTVIHL